ncbi:hypothetical protein ACOSQ2_013473 [Xanthoceras sorbifolium]
MVKHSTYLQYVFKENEEEIAEETKKPLKKKSLCASQNFMILGGSWSYVCFSTSPLVCRPTGSLRISLHSVLMQILLPSFIELESMQLMHMQYFVQESGKVTF